MTVLVTGALGFIGRHVSRHLRSKGNRVVGIGHGQVTKSEAVEAGLHRWHSGDVSRQSLDYIGEPVDLVVHCAGSSLVGDSFNDPDAEFQKSVGAAQEILEFANRQTAKPRIVVLSSAAVYGVVTQLPIRETTALKPISPYGKSKLAIERCCEEYSRDHSLQIAIVRLFSVYGPGLRKQLFWDACRKFAKGDGHFGGTGDEVRDWLHVKDAVRLIETAATQASASVPIINGGTGRSIKVRDALIEVRRFWPTAAPQITFSGQARPGDPPGYEADIARARALEWSPTHSFIDGIGEYVLWARSQIS